VSDVPARLHHRRARRGNYAILTALVLVVLLGFAALAIDLSYIRLTRLQAQNAADAGAHAALLELRSTQDQDASRARADQIVSLNVVAGEPAAIEPGRDVVFGGWDFDTKTFDPDADYVNAVEVTVRRDAESPAGAIPLMIGRVFGEDAAEVRSRGSSVGALRSRSVMVVQDITHSFADEMDEAREGNILLLDHMKQNSFPGDTTGMVCFVGEAEEWSALGQLDRDYERLRSEWLTLDWCNRDYWPYITASYSEGFHDAPQMMDCSAGSPIARAWQDSGTNQGEGIRVATEVLLDTSRVPTYSLKTIVIISDGKAQCIPEGTTCDAEVQAHGIDWANQAAAENISIFAVSLNEAYDPDQSAYLASLVRGYGQFYETPDSTELPAILEEIAKSIPISIVR
jgi:hypothetical protein